MTSNDKKYPEVGIASILFSSLALLILLPFALLGMHMLTGVFSFFSGFILLVIIFAIGGIICGVIGFRKPNKTPSIFGLILGIFGLILGIVIVIRCMYWHYSFY